MPRYVRLDASAIRDSASKTNRTAVRAWAHGLLDHGGKPALTFNEFGRPVTTDARIKYCIFALVFDISNRAFDYAGRERPPAGLAADARRTWVGRTPLPAAQLPGREPVTSVGTDGVDVHTFCKVRVPAPAEPLNGAASAADGADADDAAVADAREGERLARRCRKPRAPLLRASPRQLRQLWCAGLRHVVGCDAGPCGWTTFSRLPRRGAISTQMTQRQRARGAGFARRADATFDARRAARTDVHGAFVVEALEAALGDLPSANAVGKDDFLAGRDGRQAVRDRAGPAVYLPRGRRLERARREVGLTLAARMPREHVPAFRAGAFPGDRKAAFHVQVGRGQRRSLVHTVPGGDERAESKTTRASRVTSCHAVPERRETISSQSSQIEPQ